MSSSKSNSGLWFFVIGSTLATCGLILPIWLVVGIVYLLVNLVMKPPVVTQPKTVLPSNEFASDWMFVIRDIDDEG